MTKGHTIHRFVWRGWKATHYSNTACGIGPTCGEGGGNVPMKHNWCAHANAPDARMPMTDFEACTDHGETKKCRKMPKVCWFRVTKNDINLTGAHQYPGKAVRCIQADQSKKKRGKTTLCPLPCTMPTEKQKRHIARERFGAKWKIRCPNKA